MAKKLTVLFIIIFMAIIATPLVLVSLKIKIDPINKNEKKISLNFKRNFPLKEDLFKLFAHLKLNLLHTNPIPNDVIDTNNGWKFLGKGYSNVITESKGIKVFSKKELNLLKNNILDKKKWLKENGVKLYIAIAPNKHSVYGEMIDIKKTKNNTKFKQLDSICKTIDVSFIDLGSNFPENNTPLLYYKTDTHWNDYGAFYASQTSIKTISKDFPETKFKMLTLEDFNLEISDTIFFGDLDRMLKIIKSENEILLNFKNGPKSIIKEKKLNIPQEYQNDPESYERRHQTDVNDLKIVVFNDSFLMGTFSKYITENFGESVLIWNHEFDRKLLKSEKPDILYYEVVERNIDLFLNN